VPAADGNLCDRLSLRRLGGMLARQACGAPAGRPEPKRVARNHRRLARPPGRL
jgi:hypothetical protein